MQAAIREDIEHWWDYAASEGATHFLVVCDTFSYEDYPVLVKPHEKVSDKITASSGNMQRVMEVYKLSLGLYDQLNQKRAWNI